MPRGAPYDATHDTDPDPWSAHARELIRACEAELTGDPEPRRAGRLHFEIARLYESPLGDTRHAAAHYQEALRHTPEHLPTIRGARRVFITRKNFQAALGLFDAEARITADSSRKAALYLAKGRLLEDVLGNREEARKPYSLAHELDREDTSILKALEQANLDAAAWDGLDRILERTANAVASDPRHRAALVIERARFLESRRGATDEAIELYETALRLDPEAHGALEALKRLHHAGKRWRDLIHVLEMEADRTQDRGVRTMALYRIGRLHVDRLGNRNEALAAFERAVRESPKEPLVLDALARLYDEAERYDALADVLATLVEVTRSPDERVNLLHRMGEIYDERLGQSESAVHCYEAARRLRPTFLPVLQALGKIYAKRRDWEALVRIHLGEAEGAEDPKRRAAAHTRVAGVLETELDRVEEAIEHYGRALSLVPGYAPAFKALVRLLSAATRWRELIELYERAIDIARSRALSIAYLTKIGALYEDSLGECAQAAHIYRRILDLDPEHLGAIHALQRATERAERWEEHVNALELEIDKIRDNEDVVSLLHRTAEVLDDRLGKQDAALSFLRRALTLDPKHAPSLTRLGFIYHRSGRWDDLLDVYRRELDLSPRGTTAMTLLQKMAELSEERLGRDEDAVGYYRRILEMDPTHVPALRNLTRLLRDRGDYQELAKVLELELSGQRQADARARTAFRLGEVYEERLHKVDRAVAAYEQAVQAVPDYRPAIDALVRLRAERKAWTALVSELEREAEATADPNLSIAALLRQGEVLAEQVGDPRRALLCYERVLEESPRHLGALLALERLYRKTATWDTLGIVYERFAEVLENPAARVCALRELARLRETRGVGSPRELQSSYEAILAIIPDDTEALAGLERLALAEDNRELLRTLDEQLSEVANDPSMRALHLTRLAEYLELVGDPSALDCFRNALAEDPENIGATRGLSRLAEQMDDPRALAEAARREAQIARDGEVAARLLVRSAVVRLERIGDRQGAIGDLERALEVWPDSVDASERLAEVLRMEGDLARLAGLLSRAAASTKSVDRMAELWMSVADIQVYDLDNAAGAISSLNRVLRSAPNHIPTLSRLAELYERDGQWNEAVNLLGRLVQLAPDRDALRDAHLSLAALWGERLGETSRALVSLQAVLALDGDNQDALAQLADLHEREGHVEKAIEAAQRLVASGHASEDRATAFLRLARLEQRRGRREAAADALHDAVSLTGPGTEAALEYKSLIESHEGWETYVQALESHLARGGNPGITYLEIARVRLDHQGLRDAALRAIEAGLEHARDPDVRHELAVRLRSVGQPERAIQHFQLLVNDDVGNVKAWRDLSRTLLEVGQPRGARVAAEPLAIYGRANREEQTLLEQEPPHPAYARPGSVDAEVLRALCGFGPRERAAADLLASLEPGLHRLYPGDLEGYGLSPRDRVTTRMGHPVRQLADHIARLLGDVPFELFVHRVRTLGVSVECHNPPAVLVPAGIVDLSQAQQVFLIARPLVKVALRFYAMDKLTPRELEVLLASAGRMIESNFGSGLTSEDVLDDQARRIHKALSRRARKTMEAVARDYVEGPRVDFVRWVHLVQKTANRVAALLADDLTGVAQVLRSTERELAGLEGEDLARSSDTITEILRFWASRTSFELRQRMGTMG